MVDAPAMPRQRPVPESPVNPEEVASVRRPTLQASVLPPRAFHDQDVFDYEQDAWFAGGWVSVGRVEDVESAGQYFLAPVAGENLIIVRGNDGELRGFYNVCRHRGATILEEESGTLPRFQCPYHAWVYDLQGALKQPRHTELLVDFDPDAWGLIPVRVDTWQGIVYADLSGTAGPLHDVLGDIVPTFERFDLGALRRVRRIDYDVKANWKAIVENYLECYHCPGVHPQLNRITPYTSGSYLPSNGAAMNSYMEVLPQFETLSMTGAADGRAPMPGMTEEDDKRIYYSAVWPNQLFSLHPDYLMLHWVTPLEPGRTLVRCEWYFDPREMAKPDFNPERSDRVLGSHQPPGLARLRAAAAGDQITGLHGRPVLLDGEQRPRFRSDGGGPLRQRRRHDAPGTRLQAGEQRGHQGARQARRSGQRRRRRVNEGDGS